jgi:hypothetical protein
MPIAGGDLHVVPAGRRANTLPGLVPFVIADPLHLIEAGHRIADVAGIGQRLFPFSGEGEDVLGQLVLVVGRQSGRTPAGWLSLASGCLRGPRLVEVSARRCLLLFSRHEWRGTPHAAVGNLQRVVPARFV